MNFDDWLGLYHCTLLNPNLLVPSQWVRFGWQKCHPGAADSVQLAVAALFVSREGEMFHPMD